MKLTHELTNAKRRRFLRQSAAIGAALSLPLPASGASVGSVMGDVMINGARADRNTAIKPGDRVSTGRDSSLTFVLGRDAFMLRQMTSIVLEAKPDSALISGLRVISGALLGVFGSGMKMISTNLVTAAIRGTGIYIEAQPERTYFCTCYGEVGLTSVADGFKTAVSTRNHAAHYGHARGRGANTIVQAPMLGHTNAELAALERLAGREPVLPV